MCGRFASFRAAQDLADAFAVTDVADDARELPPSWNLAPTDPVRVVVERETDGAVRRSLRVVRWGLVPGWATDPSTGARMINARTETLATKPAFRKAAATRRCLVPAEGYYEWQPRAATGSGTDQGRSRPAKQPFWIHPGDHGVMALAGLYEFWRDPARADDDPLRWLVTMAIVTEAAQGALAAIHDRRPVVLQPELWDAWLDPRLTDLGHAADLLVRRPPELVTQPVSTEVNRVGNDGPQLIEPLDGALDDPTRDAPGPG